MGDEYEVEKDAGKDADQWLGAELTRESALRSTVVWRVPQRVSASQRASAVACGVAVIVVVLVAVLHARGHATASTLTRNDLGTSIPIAAAELANDGQQTAPIFSFPSTAAEGLAVAPIFTSYYDAHGGAAFLGTPITPAYPTADGTVQFFSAGGLIAGQGATATPAATGSAASASTATTTSVAITRVPVVSTLLSTGSLVTLGGDGGSLTYATLRDAAKPDQLQAIPSPLPTSGVFIGEGHRGATVIGHTIAQQIYDYISDPDVSPDGWQQDVGMPLTEALGETVMESGAQHTLLVQAFENVVLACDVTSQDPATQTVTPVDAGAAYLRTLAPPAVELGAGTSLWTTGSLAIVSQPGGGTVSVHLGQNVALTGASGGQAAQWVGGALWYHVQWKAPKRSGEGWAPATALTLASPGSAPAYASFDVFSPSLQSYLASYGGNVSAVVYDETRNTYYTYNPTASFTLASSAKVPIMLTFLTMTEHQGREPDGDEQNLLQTMIENSNNDSAQALYEEVGYDDGIRSFLASVGIYDWTPNPDGWGWSSFSPTSMVRLLTLLHDGKVLTAQDRALALNLMGNIQPDQQVGVGDTAPAGATVAMKDGWVTAPDGLWAVNSSGIVTVGGETYEIAVYTQDFGDITTGWDIVRTVAGDVGQALA